MVRRNLLNLVLSIGSTVAFCKTDFCDPVLEQLATASAPFVQTLTRPEEVERFLAGAGGRSTPGFERGLLRDLSQHAGPRGVREFADALATKLHGGKRLFIGAPGVAQSYAYFLKNAGQKTSVSLVDADVVVIDAYFLKSMKADRALAEAFAKFKGELVLAPGLGLFDHMAPALDGEQPLHAAQRRTFSALVTLAAKDPRRSEPGVTERALAAWYQEELAKVTELHGVKFDPERKPDIIGKHRDATPCEVGEVARIRDEPPTSPRPADAEDPTALALAEAVGVFVSPRKLYEGVTTSVDAFLRDHGLGPDWVNQVVLVTSATTAHSGSLRHVTSVAANAYSIPKERLVSIDELKGPRGKALVEKLGAKFVLYLDDNSQSGAQMGENVRALRKALLGADGKPVATIDARPVAATRAGVTGIAVGALRGAPLSPAVRAFCDELEAFEAKRNDVVAKLLDVTAPIASPELAGMRRRAWDEVVPALKALVDAEKALMVRFSKLGPELRDRYGIVVGPPSIPIPSLLAKPDALRAILEEAERRPGPPTRLQPGFGGTFSIFSTYYMTPDNNLSVMRAGEQPLRDYILRNVLSFPENYKDD